MAPITTPGDTFNVEVSNRTSYHLSLSPVSSTVQSQVLRTPTSQARSFNVDRNLVVKRSLSFSIVIADQSNRSELDSKADPISNSFSIRVLNSSSTVTVTTSQDLPCAISYQPIRLPDSLSQKIWAIQSLPSINSTQPITIHFFPTRSLSNFLSKLPSNLPISSIALPGTHESLARYGWPISSCQSLTSDVTYQLNNGIRYFDVRMVPKGEGVDAKLFAYHGITDQRITLDEVLKQCYDWLDGDGKEDFILMSMKQESGPNPPVFDNLLSSRYIGPNLSKWYLNGSTIPTLSQVRGRIVLFSRFGTGNQSRFGVNPNLEIGIHASKWPNSLKGLFDFQLPDAKSKCQVQDWYSISTLASIPEKFNLIKSLISEGNAGYDRNILGINYCNGSDFPGALPPLVAKGFLSKIGVKCLRTVGVNELLTAELLQRLKFKPDFEAGDLHQEKNEDQTRGPAASKDNRWFNWNQEKSIESQSKPPKQENEIKPVAQTYGLMSIFALDFFDEPKGTAAEYLPRLIVEANFMPGLG